MHVCTSAVTTECVSRGMMPSSVSEGWPIIVWNTGAGQPLAIWRGSLVCWLASHLDGSTHTTVASLETEDRDFAQYVSREGFVGS